jgi:hypothetical protein
VADYYTNEHGEVATEAELRRRLAGERAPLFKFGQPVVASRTDGNGRPQPFHYGAVTKVLGREGGGYEYELTGWKGRFVESMLAHDRLPFAMDTIVRECATVRPPRHGKVIEPRTTTGLVGVAFTDGCTSYRPKRS